MCFFLSPEEVLGAVQMMTMEKNVKSHLAPSLLPSLIGKNQHFRSHQDSPVTLNHAN